MRGSPKKSRVFREGKQVLKIMGALSGRSFVNTRPFTQLKDQLAQGINDQEPETVAKALILIDQHMEGLGLKLKEAISKELP
jgi:hypothetical protein